MPLSLALRAAPLPLSVRRSFEALRQPVWASLAVIGMAVTAVIGFAAWRHLYPVTPADGWHYSTYLDSIDKVSALAFDGHGRLVLSEERSNGAGRLLRQDDDGGLAEVLAGLGKPDGLTAFQGGIAFSQEQGPFPVGWLGGGAPVNLFDGRNVEGLAADGDLLYAIEDRAGSGRLLRYDARLGRLDVLRSGLDEGEAVATCPDGRLFYGEKRKGEIRQYAGNGNDPLVAAGLNQPGYLLCTADGLWITEDATHMARLLLLDNAGALHTVLSHLRSAQTLIETGPGEYLLAEQGRNRVLQLQRDVAGS